MITEYIRYTINETRQNKFISAYQKGSVPLLRSKYCLAYDLCQCVEDPSQFTIRLQWSSAEDHMKKFRSSAEFKEFFVFIKDFVDDIVEMRHYNCLEAHYK